MDPRIYRAGLALVAIGVIIFGFSLENQPPAATTTIAPPAYTGPRLAELAETRAADGPSRFAAYVESQLRSQVAVGGAAGFTVTSTSMAEQTVAGLRQVPVVTASRSGVSSGMIVVVSDRDAPGEAGVSSTAVLIALAHALAAATQSHPVMLVSIGGQVGAAGATALARSLAGAGQPVGAVLVLGDLAARHPVQPLVVPFSNTDLLAPPMLTLTAARYLAAQTGLQAAAPDLGTQLAHLAFPMTVTDQGPFARFGIAAVLISLSGSRLTTRTEAVRATLPPQLFAAVMQTLEAIDGAGPVPGPSAYLVLSGKLVPLWAVRLLVLVLIVPVVPAVVDALARARRRGHSISRWLVWALAGVLPFLVAVAIVLLGRGAGLITAAPPELTGPGAVPLGVRGVVLIALAAVGWLLAFFVLRPFCIRLALSRLGAGQARRASTPAGDAAAVALSIVLCVTALVAWLLNPFAALLLVPALHLWLWLAREEVRARRWLVALLVLAGILPAVGLVAYYAHAFGLASPAALAWSATLLLAGGGVPAAAIGYWSVALACAVGAVLIGIRASRAAASTSRIDPVVTMRGPLGYAGPGSLGGTESALRR